MTIRQMEFFVSVYTEKSITKAARKLSVAQSAVSKYIREIEEYYGHPLFEHVGRNIYPTPFADQLYQYASKITDLVTQMDFSLESFEDNSKVIRIATGTAIGLNHMVDAVKIWKDLHPETEIKLFSGDQKSIVQKLTDNEIDFAILEWMSANPMIAEIPFLSEQIIPVCCSDSELAKTTSVSPAMLQNIPLLLRESGSQIRKATDRYFSAMSMGPNTLWESTSVPLLLKAVSENLGISFVTKSQLYSPQATKVKSFKIEGFDESIMMKIYIHQDKKKSSLINSFIRFFTSYMESKLSQSYSS